MVNNQFLIFQTLLREIYAIIIRMFERNGHTNNAKLSQRFAYRVFPLKLRLDGRTDGFVRMKITNQIDGLTPKGISTRFMMVPETQ